MVVLKLPNVERSVHATAGGAAIMDDRTNALSLRASCEYFRASCEQRIQ